jgi:hypothetical protein
LGAGAGVEVGVGLGDDVGICDVDAVVDGATEGEGDDVGDVVVDDLSQATSNVPTSNNAIRIKIALFIIFTSLLIDE